MPAVDTRPQFKTFPSLRPDPKEEGLVAAWDLGSPVNGICPDLVGSNNGTVNGGAIVGSTPLGKGMQFDGADDYIDIYQSRSFTSFSLESWFRTTTNYGGNTAGGFWFSDGVLTNIFHACIGTGVRSWIRDAAGNSIHVAPATVRSDGLWHHFVTVFDAASKTVYQYVDGAPTGSSQNLNVTPPFVLGAGSQQWIGRGNAYFNGNQFGHGIYNRALSDQEVKTKYLKAKSAMWRAGYGVGVSSADEGGIINDTLGRLSGVDSGVRFGDTTVRARFETAQIQGKTCKVIACRTAAGVLGVPTVYFGQNTTESAFGTFEFYVYKGADANVFRVMFIAAVNAAWNNASQNGYLFEIDANEAVKIQRITAGAVASTLMQSANAYVANSTWYKITITRTTAGVFTLKIEDALMSVTGGSGANPSAADVTHTTSSWLSPDLDVGDIVGWACPTGSAALKKLVIAS